MPANLPYLPLAEAAEHPELDGDPPEACSLPATASTPLSHPRRREPRRLRPNAALVISFAGACWRQPPTSWTTSTRYSSRRNASVDYVVSGGTAAVGGALDRGREPPSASVQDLALTTQNVAIVRYDCVWAANHFHADGVRAERLLLLGVELGLVAAFVG